MSSHSSSANTIGRPLVKGDTLGVHVTYMGHMQSTVVFTLNNEPVATRYLFETDKRKLLPTIAFQKGPIQAEVMWPHAVNASELPCYASANFIDWIRPTGENCQFSEPVSEFENLAGSVDMVLQSPVPLNKTQLLFRCIQLDCEMSGESSKRAGASVGLASCSPLKPTPTSKLLRDYYTWLPRMKRIIRLFKKIN